MTDVVETVPDVSLNTEEILNDYRIGYRSRQASYAGRREVMAGKAKFGIFGDGKELPQLAMAHAFRPGDWRSGYYRDQTLMLALGALTLEEFFAQLYAHADVEHDPATGGRAMNAHFSTRSLDAGGNWKVQTDRVNSSTDLSPTASQMPRLVGLAYASRLYREVEGLRQFTQFSHHGDEVAFGTIGNASAAEGMFWEAVNAIGVLGAPALITIYDDEYGISVPNQYQMVNGDLSELLKGFQRRPGTGAGYDLYTVRGWDYPALLEAYRAAVETARQEHVPALLHVIELTQPQGHSTSGSHERYKSKERLQWEAEFDCLAKFRGWIVAQGIAASEELDEMEAEERPTVEQARRRAWSAFTGPILAERKEAAALIEALEAGSPQAAQLRQVRTRLAGLPNPLRRDIHSAVQAALVLARAEPDETRQGLAAWKKMHEADAARRYSSHLYLESGKPALKVPEVKPVYESGAPEVHGFEVINACFEAAFAREPRLVAFGEDVGRLGDVNQGFKGLQARYGELRVTDTGIRETTIVGQAIGLALRGLRPIAEIQYLDYLLYALQILSDDLATLHWRSAGGQCAPVILRTRGHRLEGIWHSGSLMGGFLNLLRGMYLLVPRNMTQAAGFYNTLFRSEDPALVVEVLNGYRVRERLPSNVGEFTVPLGVPEVLRGGTDVTLVTYGACCRLALEAAEALSRVGIEAEVIDVQSLVPFDLQGRILESLKKTSRILFIDEDVPGGATAYMLQQVIEKQGGYYWLDSEPRTLPGQPHRPAYGSDGDYWSKPNAETIFGAVYDLMHEVDPVQYPRYD